MDDQLETDFLVIGGGSGGSTAAGRLAASGATVTLLESGGTNARPDVTDPGRWPELLESDANWGYRTVPQGAAAGRVHSWPMGRLLGGSSSVNGMKWMRGGPWDYDRWVEMGAPGWDAESVYRVYRAMEDFPEGDQSFHGTGGPIRLTQVQPDHPLTAAFLQASAAQGFRRSPDFNSLDATGYGLNQLNVSRGRREDAGSVMIGDADQYPNLTIWLNTTARRLHVGPDGRVDAVTVIRGGVIRTVRVNAEVIVSAGAIASPQLLLLSGIGPATHLEQVGVNVAVDLPGVGENLHDHIGVPLVWESRRPIPPSNYQATEVSLYLPHGPTASHFDMQITMHQFAAYLPPEYECGPNGFTFFPGTLKPLSRGRVQLASGDADVMPLIDPAYLSAEEDVDRLEHVVEVTRDLAADKAFEEWRGREVGPGSEVRSSADVREYIRKVASTYFHPSGTCRMGSDELAVVDERLRLRGVTGVRVADASIMPEIVSGNTNAPAMMIGWRAAEFALADA